MRECPNCGYGCKAQIVNYFWKHISTDSVLEPHTDCNNFLWECPACHKEYELGVEINVHFHVVKDSERVVVKIVDALSGG